MLFEIGMERLPTAVIAFMMPYWPSEWDGSNFAGYAVPLVIATLAGSILFTLMIWGLVTKMIQQGVSSLRRRLRSGARPDGGVVADPGDNTAEHARQQQRPERQVPSHGRAHLAGRATLRARDRQRAQPQPQQQQLHRVPQEPREAQQGQQQQLRQDTQEPMDKAYNRSHSILDLPCMRDQVRLADYLAKSRERLEQERLERNRILIARMLRMLRQDREKEAKQEQERLEREKLLQQEREKKAKQEQEAWERKKLQRQERERERKQQWRRRQQEAEEQAKVKQQHLDRLLNQGYQQLLEREREREREQKQQEQDREQYKRDKAQRQRGAFFYVRQWRREWKQKRDRQQRADDHAKSQEGLQHRQQTPHEKREKQQQRQQQQEQQREQEKLKRKQQEREWEGKKKRKMKALPGSRYVLQREQELEQLKLRQQEQERERERKKKAAQEREGKCRRRRKREQERDRRAQAQLQQERQHWENDDEKSQQGLPYQQQTPQEKRDQQQPQQQQQQQRQGPASLGDSHAVRNVSETPPPCPGRDYGATSGTPTERRRCTTSVLTKTVKRALRMAGTEDDVRRITLSAVLRTDKDVPGSSTGLPQQQIRKRVEHTLDFLCSPEASGLGRKRKLGSGKKVRKTIFWAHVGAITRQRRLAKADALPESAEKRQGCNTGGVLPAPRVCSPRGQEQREVLGQHERQEDGNQQATVEARPLPGLTRGHTSKVEHPPNSSSGGFSLGREPTRQEVESSFVKPTSGGKTVNALPFLPIPPVGPLAGRPGGAFGALTTVEARPLPGLTRGHTLKVVHPPKSSTGGFSMGKRPTTQEVESSFVKPTSGGKTVNALPFLPIPPAKPATPTVAIPAASVTVATPPVPVTTGREENPMRGTVSAYVTTAAAAAVSVTTGSRSNG
ncbi:unnamed protein product [Ectocarpus sp. 4 AP-2014]